MTVSQLKRELSYSEYLDWVAFYKQQNEAAAEDSKPKNVSWESKSPEDIKAMFGA